jgi:hypothetical protein
MSGSTAGDRLDDTCWCVPTDHLPALQAINANSPLVSAVNDQTVWHFTEYLVGYIIGIGRRFRASATGIC